MDTQPLVVEAVKSSLGHAEPGADITSMARTHACMCLRVAAPLTQLRGLSAHLGSILGREAGAAWSHSRWTVQARMNARLQGWLGVELVLELSLADRIHPNRWRASPCSTGPDGVAPNPER